MFCGSWWSTLLYVLLECLVQLLNILLILKPKRFVLPLKSFRKMSDVRFFLNEVTLELCDVKIFLLELLLHIHQLKFELSILVTVLKTAMPHMPLKHCQLLLKLFDL